MHDFHSCSRVQRLGRCAVEASPVTIACSRRRYRSVDSVYCHPIVSARIQPIVTQPSVLRPVLYSVILLASIVGTYVVKLRTAGIFGCSAEGYYASTNAYLGYCNASAYGDYDHGAFWFDLEPEARKFAADAAVLFVGSSRMQFAFSSIATDKWFAAAAVPHYLMGFTHTENSNFLGPLLQRVKPHAKVYVINIDQFFVGTETGPASQILHDGDIERRYREKRLWQHVHR